MEQVGKLERSNRKGSPNAIPVWMNGRQVRIPENPLRRITDAWREAYNALRCFVRELIDVSAASR